jgi:plastocyanin domain-containing protein
MKRIAAVFAASLPLLLWAAGEPEFSLSLENHRFTPDRLEIPAGKKVKVTVENKDATPEEFESNALKIEKVIPGKSKGIVFIGPLKAGEYAFVGEYNEKTAKGVVVAK